MEIGKSTEKQPPSAPPPYTTYPTGDSELGKSQYGFQAPQPGYPPYSQPGNPYQPNLQTPTYGGPMPQMVQPSPVNQQTVIVMGGCPKCRVGVLEDSYTCCGICCAIFFFPIGILCCLAMKEKRCTNCNSAF